MFSPLPHIPQPKELQSCNHHGAARPAPGDFLKDIYSNFGDDLELSLPKCTNDTAMMLKLCLAVPRFEQLFLHVLSFILLFF